MHRFLWLGLPFAAARQRAVWRDNHHNRTPTAECAYEFGDCTSSKCCVSPSLLCLRRADFHAAQCRNEQTACTPWGDRTRAGAHDWLCPGWEICGSAWNECTASRCCADEGYGCYLNKSSNVASYMNKSDATLHLNRSHHVSWFAQCRQINLTKCATHRLPAHGVTGWTGAATLHPVWAGTLTHAASGGNRSAATKQQEWICPLSWMEWEDALWVAVTARSAWLSLHVVAKYLATAVTVTLSAVCVCRAVAGLHRMHVFAQLRREARGSAHEAVDDDAKRREQETSAVMSRLRTHAERAKMREERQEDRRAEQAGLMMTTTVEHSPSRGRCSEHELVRVDESSGGCRAVGRGDSHPSGDEVHEGERRAPGRRWGMSRWPGDNLFSLLKGV